MNKILPILIVLLAVAAAGFGAMMLRGSPDLPDAEQTEGYDGSGEKSYGGGKKEDGPKIGYYRFQRAFIVPVVDKSVVGSIVLLSLSVELPESQIEVLRSKEPRIRDAFMQALLGLSHDGIFDGDITSPSVYQTLQTTLTEVAKATMGEDVEQVLIVDFARQER